MSRVFYRDTWAEVNLESITYNIEQIKRKLPDSTHITAVVKANGYGHGAIQIAKRALKSGANVLAVSLLEEALELRESGIVAPILVLGWVSPDKTPLAAKEGITLTFFQKEWLKEVNKITFKKNLNLHMKWDTGMGRIGLSTEMELKQLLQELNKNEHIHLTGVYTHFATADNLDLTYFHEQKVRFHKLLNVFKDLWKSPVTIHIGNSAASIRFPKEMHQFIRFGIAMYGLYPSQIMKKEKHIDLKQAFSLYSRLIHVKKISKGETISYGATYKAKGDEWIGTIPIGYGDGWIRKLQGANVLVDGKRVPIIGRICMDQTMIRLDKEYAVGTKITLIGRQGDECIEMDEVANYLETINYEIPCMINQRIPRIYLGNTN